MIKESGKAEEQRGRQQTSKSLVLTMEENRNTLKVMSRGKAEDSLTKNLIKKAGDFLINKMTKKYTKCLQSKLLKPGRNLLYYLYVHPVLVSEASASPKEWP